MLDNCPIWPRNESGLMAWARQHVLAARHDLKTARCKLEIDLAAPLAQTRELLNQTFPGTKASCWGVTNAARQASNAVAPGRVGSPVGDRGETQVFSPEHIPNKDAYLVVQQVHGSLGGRGIYAAATAAARRAHVQRMDR